MLEFTLKQHTPIIHFQHYQSGAALRASEFKPKLDKFLIRKLKLTEYKSIGGEEIEVAKGEFISWFNNKEKLSLDYKAKITYEIESIYDYIEQPKRIKGIFKQKREDDGTYSTERKNYPLYFGNMGRNYYETDTIKKFVFNSGNINLKIHSFNPDLIQKIKENMAEFLALENFGSRQDKGFGSFYLNNTDANCKLLEEKLFDYKFEITMTSSNLWQKFRGIFDQLDLFYRALRPGINLKDNAGNDKFYFKSLLFSYFKTQNIQWEKKTIKEKFFLNDVKRSDGSVLYYGLNSQKKIRPSSDVLRFQSRNKKLVKDLLGLSTNESWKYYGNSITKTEAKDDRNGNKIKKDESDDQIERFKSPMFFKVIENKDGEKYLVYIKLWDDIPIRGKWFIIEDKKGQRLEPMQIPEDFTLHKFFEFISDKSQFDIATHVESGFLTADQWNTLKNIFDSLSKITVTSSTGTTI